MIPLLDLSAGVWNYNMWKDSGSEEWILAYRIEMIFGIWNFLSWVIWFNKNSLWMVIFEITAISHTFIEAANFYLVYRANTIKPN